ncbi:MAG: winged helix-turn-helix domain-containing protein, partial [Caldilinea sp.]|nr:winged helix-turn-helix domain-containing protein [Caldilinea sp.]
MQTTLHVTLFGTVQVTHPSQGERLNLAPGVQALFAYLLLQSRPVPRDVLLEVFWGERPPARARNSLNTAIWRLRQALEPDGIAPQTYLLSNSTGEVGFNWESQHWVDVECFSRQTHRLLRKPAQEFGPADAAQIEECLALYRGELLESLYDDWALRERERYRTIHLNCLARLMEYHAGRRSFEQSITYGQEILRHDPLREDVHRCLMRFYLENGQRALAQRQYHRCCELLEQEMGVPPLEETQVLYQQLAATTPAGVAFGSAP